MASKKIDPGEVAWVQEGEGGPGHYLHGEEWVQLVQDDPEDPENGDGHFEPYSGDPDDYVHAR